MVVTNTNKTMKRYYYLGKVQKETNRKLHIWESDAKPQPISQFIKLVKISPINGGEGDELYYTKSEFHKLFKEFE